MCTLSIIMNKRKLDAGLQDFVVNLKQMLQAYDKVLTKCFLLYKSESEENSGALELSISINFHGIP